MTLRKMPDEYGDKCNLVCAEAEKKNLFSVLRLVIQKDGTTDFYEWLNSEKDVNKKSKKKPTDPGKEKAAACCKRIEDKTNELFPGYFFVCAKIESKKHGVFVISSYKRCPIDIIEYLISERN